VNDLSAVLQSRTDGMAKKQCSVAMNSAGCYITVDARIRIQAL